MEQVHVTRIVRIALLAFSLLYLADPTPVLAQGDDASKRVGTRTDEERRNTLTQCPAYFLADVDPDLVNMVHRERFGDWSTLGPQRFVLAPEGYYGGIGRINILEEEPGNPRVFYAGAAAGALWRTKDGGQGWEPLTGAYGISGITIDPRDHDTIYILTGDGEGYGGSAYFVESFGVLVSKDGGKSWNLTGDMRAHVDNWSNQRAFVGYDLKLSPWNPHILIATTTWGLFRSVNSGADWEQIDSNGWYYDLEFHPKQRNIVYASAQWKIMKSEDEGENWEQVWSLSEAAQTDKRITSNIARPRIELSITSASPDTVYALVGANYPQTAATGGLVALLRSDQQGRPGTWNVQSTTPNILGSDDTGSSVDGSPWYVMTMAVSPVDVDEVWVGGKILWKSVDGGRIWRVASSWDQRDSAYLYRSIHPDIQDLDYTELGLLASTDGGVYMKIKHHDLWSDLSEGLDVTQVYSLCGQRRDAEIFYLGAQDNGTNKVSQKTATQILANYVVGDAMVCLVHPENPDILYASGQKGRIMKSTDGGQEFVSINPPNSYNYGNVSWVTPFAMSPDDPNTIYGCWNSAWVTHDAGSTWTELPAEGFTPNQTGCVAIAATPASKDKPAYIYVAKEGAVLRGTETGTSWEDITTNLFTVEPPGNSTTKISDLAVNPFDPDEIWVTSLGHIARRKVFRGSTGKDGTYSWENVSGLLPNINARAVLYSDEEKGLYVGMDCGVYFRDEKMPDWIDFDKGLKGQLVTDLIIQHDQSRDLDVIRAGTFSWGVWESPLHSYESRKPAP